MQIARRTDTVLDAPWVPAEPFRRIAARPGHLAHVALAALACFAASGDNLLIEIAGVPLLVCVACRARSMLQAWRWFFTQPLVLAFLAWAGWQAAALAWSRDAGEGLAQLATLRWVWIAPVIYPVLDARRALIVFVVLGFIVAQSTQALQLLGQWLDIPALTFGQFPDRIAGWWHPVIAGTLLVGAMGYSIPPAFFGRGPERGLGLIGVLASTLGIVATGSRGAWIAGAMLLAGAILAALVRRRPSRALIARAGVVILALGLVVGVVLRGPISSRAGAAASEIRAALVEDRFDSSVGARLAMIRWSIDAVRDRPIVGVGQGSFEAWSRDRARVQGFPDEHVLFHGHAHNTPLHVLATTGLVGLAFFLAFWSLAVRGAWRAVPPGAFGTFAAGPFVALLGLTLCWPFDAIHVNSQTMANVALLIGLCPSTLPRAHA